MTGPTSDQGSTRKAVSRDGTVIVACVRGHGSPVVLLPAGPADSELAWRHVVPHLSEHHTCYLLETRGRGLSGDQPDHCPDRLVEDVLALTESVGEPVGLVGWGPGNVWARVAARKDAALVGLAVYDPGADEVRRSEEASKRRGEMFTRMRELVDEGRLVDAAHTFVESSDVFYPAEDLASGIATKFWEATAARIPLWLDENRQAAESEQPGPTSPSQLREITIPVLLMPGERTSQWYSHSAEHVARHVADATLRPIPGAAHFGPHTHPRAVADEIIRFFARIHAAT